MKYVQLLKSGDDITPVELLQNSQKEIILISAQNNLSVITGIIKNWSWNYKLKVNFFLAGRENGEFILNPLQKIVFENRPADRIFLSIEDNAQTTFSLYQYHIEQLEAEGEEEPIQLLYRMKVDIIDDSLEDVNGMAQEFISTYQLNLNVGEESTLASCLDNQDLLIKDVYARVIGVSTEIKDADGTIIKNPSWQDYQNSINIKHNVKQDIPVDSLIGMNYVFRYPDDQQLVRNEFQSYITKDTPRLALEKIDFKARRETGRGMDFNVVPTPSGLTQGFVWILVITIRFYRTLTPEIVGP